MNGVLDAVTNVNNAVNGVVWGVPALALLASVGVLMTVLTKVFQVSHFGHWMKKTIGAVFKDKHVTSHTKDKSISQFQSLCTALAATVGTGNIVGVSGAILMGGPGAVFWMWVMAFLGMMTNYSENVLGIFYRRKNSQGEWSGGAMYYLRDGLGSKKGCAGIGKVLALLFSLFLPHRLLRHRQHDAGERHLRQHANRLRPPHLGHRRNRHDPGRTGRSRRPEAYCRGH